MISASDRFHVLFVCTGNICRSPIAEQVFRARVTSPEVTFASAGTGALVDSGMPEPAAALSMRMGGTPANHRAQQLTKSMLSEADLVIALSREHRSEIVRTLPRASRYTFTLRETARLLESLVADESVQLPDSAGVARPEYSRAIVHLVAQQRGFADQPVVPESDDVVDPYRREQAVYDLTGEQIGGAIDRILVTLGELT